MLGRYWLILLNGGTKFLSHKQICIFAGYVLKFRYKSQNLSTSNLRPKIHSAHSNMPCKKDIFHIDQNNCSIYDESKCIWQYLHSGCKLTPAWISWENTKPSAFASVLQRPKYITAKPSLGVPYFIQNMWFSAICATMHCIDILHSLYSEAFVSPGPTACKNELKIALYRIHYCFSFDVSKF